MTFELSQCSSPASALIGSGTPGSRWRKAHIWGGESSNAAAVSSMWPLRDIMSRLRRVQASVAGSV